VQTCAYISRQLLWLACLEVVCFGGIQHLTIQANRMSPVRLPIELFLGIVSPFGFALVLWIIVFVRHFAKTAEPAAGGNAG
jgi:hypothetical protein